jgi:hypothetical protein
MNTPLCGVPLTPLPVREATGVRATARKRMKRKENLLTPPPTLDTVTGLLIYSSRNPVTTFVSVEAFTFLPFGFPESFWDQASAVYDSPQFLQSLLPPTRIPSNLAVHENRRLDCRT